MICIGAKVKIMSEGACGIVYITNRSSSNPIGVISDNKSGYDFLEGESWIPRGKEEFAWVGKEDELEIISESPLEILYESLMKSDGKRKEGYYKKEVLG